MNDTRIHGYRDFLRRRDGEADLLNRRLANREDFFNWLETNPVRSLRPADRTTFLRNMRRRKPLFLLLGRQPVVAAAGAVESGATEGPADLH